MSVLGGGVAAAACLWALSGVYVVGPNERAMVSRLGAVVGEADAGLNYHLPAPLGAVQRLPAGGLNRLELGAASGEGTAGRMLTRDDNLVDVAFTLQWRITDPRRYLAGLSDPDAQLRLAAESAMRQAVGQLSLAVLRSSSRAEAGRRAAALLQAVLDREQAGIEVADVQVRDVQPPDGAQDGFHDVAAAETEGQAALREAAAYRARVVAEARGDAAKAVQTSQGYRDQEVSEARGEADRFALVDAQYRKAPQVTRDRLYTETMERVLHSASKIILPASKGASTPLVLPSELFRPRPATPPAAAPSASQAGPAAGQTPAAAAAGPAGGTTL